MQLFSDYGYFLKWIIILLSIKRWNSSNWMYFIIGVLLELLKINYFEKFVLIYDNCDLIFQPKNVKKIKIISIKSTLQSIHHK